MSGQRSAKKRRFGDFKVPPDWKEGVKSNKCYHSSISRAGLPPYTKFQRKIQQNVPGCTLFFLSEVLVLQKKMQTSENVFNIKIVQRVYDFYIDNVFLDSFCHKYHRS